MKKVLILVTIAASLAACSSTSKKEERSLKTEVVEKIELSQAQRLVSNIENAHKKQLFRSFDAIQFDLNLTFGGNERFNGRIYMMTDASEIKMEDADGLKYWDGKKAMVLPDTANNNDARFGLLTWSYFFAAPYKLSDPGASHEYLSEIPLLDETYQGLKMTFAAGVGDAPDDWYVVYKDNNSDLLAAMAYIVTGGGASVEEAEEDPHAITYEAFVDVQGVPFATQWNFWTWNKKGEMDKLLGSASIANIEFIKVAGDMFSSLVAPSDES